MCGTGLALYVYQASEGIPSVLLSDSYYHHMMPTTSLCHHMDIEFNQALKTCTYQQWEKWIIAEELVNGFEKQSTRQNISELVTDGCFSVPMTVGFVINVVH